MNCEEARKLWNDRIDKVGNPAEWDMADAHMKACAECRKYKAQMSDLLGALDYLRLESAKKPTHRRVRMGLASWLKIAAAIVIVCGTLLLMVRPFKISAPSANEARSFAKTLRMTTGVSEIPRTMVKLKQESAQRLLAIQYKTDNPKVHLFVLYPTARSISTEKNLN